MIIHNYEKAIASFWDTRYLPFYLFSFSERTVNLLEENKITAGRPVPLSYMIKKEIRFFYVRKHPSSDNHPKGKRFVQE